MDRRLALRLATAAAAALVAVAPIVAGALVTGATPAPAAPAPLRFTPQATPPATLTPLPPTARGGELTAAVQRPTPLRATPGGRVIATVASRTAYGSPTILWAPQTSGPWVAVISEQAGNNRVGWVARTAVVLARTEWKIEVSLSRHRLTVLDGTRALLTVPVAFGMPSAPTPTGHFAVTDRLRTADPTGPYGCCVLALTAVAPHPIENWGGGNRVAIHSTLDTASIGRAASHGCVRVRLADGRWLLAHVPLGTPTVIRA